MNTLICDGNKNPDRANFSASLLLARPASQVGVDATKSLGEVIQCRSDALINCSLAADDNREDNHRNSRQDETPRERHSMWMKDKRFFFHRRRNSSALKCRSEGFETPIF